MTFKNKNLTSTFSFKVSNFLAVFASSIPKSEQKNSAYNFQLTVFDFIFCKKLKVPSWLVKKK